MSTGKRPFQGETSISTIGAILKDEPASITDLKPALPRHVGRIIRRCLAKDPDLRYQTALDVRNEVVELKREIQSGMHAGSPLAVTRAVSRPVRWAMLVAGALLAVVAGVLISRGMQQDRSKAKRPYTTVPISTGLGMEMIPTWSPGGESIAFAEVRNGSLDVVVKSMAGGEPVVRANGPGDETSPRWSPDGRYLAYVSTSVPGTPVFLVPPHGGQARKLIDTGFLRTGLEPWVVLGHQPWSADGRTLLVSLKSGSGQAVIHRVERDNETAEPLTLPPPGKGDYVASYSPDGKTVVFVRSDDWPLWGNVMSVSAEGGNAELLVKDAGSPAFHADGRHLLFNRAANIWELDLDTGEETQLTFESVQPISTLAVSGTNRIAFQTFWHTTFLYRIDVATGDQRQLTSHTGDNLWPRFSPDGETIAYASTRTGEREIYLHPLDGGRETRLTDRGSGNLPDWSPDGRHLVIVEQVDSSARRLTVVNRDGGGARVLVEQPGFGPVRWSPSGKRIAYVAIADGVPSIWTVGSDGNDARSIHQSAGAFDWYLDDRHGIFMTFAENETEMEMFAIDLETGKTRSLYRGPILELDVAPDGSAVALAMGPGHMSLSLVILRLEPSDSPDGLPRVVGEPDYLVQAEGNWHIHLGGWSADSKSIVYTLDQDYGDIYELVKEE
jgi:Tol biopolymer transport system component